MIIFISTLYSPDTFAEEPLKVIAEAEWPHQYAGGVQFSPDGAMLAAWGGDDSAANGSDDDAKSDGFALGGHLVFWDTRTWNRGAEIAFPGEMVASASFSHDGSIVACGFLSGAVKLYHLETGDVTELAAKAGQVVQFAPEHNILAVSAFGGRVTLWDVQVKEQLAVNERRGRFVSNHRPIAFSPSGQILAVGQVAPAGHEVNEIELCDTMGLNPVATLRADTDQASSLAFSADGGKVYSLANDGFVVAWNVELQQETTRFRAIDERQASGTGAIDISRNGNLLATSACDHVTIWKLEEHQFVETIAGKGGICCYVDIAPDGEDIATITSPGSSDTAQLTIWRVGDM